MDFETLPWENPLGNNYFASQFYLNERGARRYAELVGFQRALALQDEEAAAHLGAEFRNVVEFVSVRTNTELECSPGVKVQVPSSTVVAGDDGSFGCFTFYRYTPCSRDLALARKHLLQSPDSNDDFYDWRPGSRAEPPQSDGVGFRWAFSYNGAIIYRGPRSTDEWREWKKFAGGRWWSSHT